MINTARLDPAALASNAAGKTKDNSAPADAMQFSAHLAEHSRRDTTHERPVHTDASRAQSRESERAERREARAECEPADTAAKPRDGKTKDSASTDRASRADTRSRAARDDAAATQDDAPPVDAERVATPATAQSTDSAPADTETSDKAAAPPDGSLPDQVLALLAGLPPMTTAAPAPETTIATPAAPALLSTLPGGTPVAATPLASAALDGASALAALATAPATADATQAARADDTLGAFAALMKDKDAPELGAGTREALPDGRIALPGVGSTDALVPRTAVTAAAAVATMAPLDLDEGFEDAFGARIGWMADQKLGEAELRVTPEHMGPIDVRLQLDGTRVSAQFQTHQPEVKQAIESSLGRLRDMLGQHGLQLAQADVGQRQAGNGQGSSARGGFGHGEGAGESDTPRVVTMRRLRGLLDEYA